MLRRREGGCCPGDQHKIQVVGLRGLLQRGEEVAYDVALDVTRAAMAGADEGQRHEGPRPLGDAVRLLYSQVLRDRRAELLHAAHVPRRWGLGLPADIDEVGAGLSGRGGPVREGGDPRPRVVPAVGAWERLQAGQVRVQERRGRVLKGGRDMEPHIGW